MLDELVAALRREHITLLVARLNSPLVVRFDATDLTTLIGAGRFYGNVRVAVQAGSQPRSDDKEP